MGKRFVPRIVAIAASHGRVCQLDDLSESELRLRCSEPDVGARQGNPLTEPVDTYVKPEKTPSPALVNYLMRLMVDLTTICLSKRSFLTKTFQFAANPKSWSSAGIHGRQLQRMSAEQIWDSLVTLVAEHPDKLAKRKFSNHIYYNNKPVLVGEMTMSQLAQEGRNQDPAKYREYAENLLQKINPPRAVLPPART